MGRKERGWSSTVPAAIGKADGEMSGRLALSAKALLYWAHRMPLLLLCSPFAGGYLFLEKDL